MPNKETITEYLQSLQDSICQQLELADGHSRFIEDKWKHHSGGGGRTRVIQNGNNIEKGGVNYSSVTGTTSAALQKQLKIDEELDFFATGVSIVMHPLNPHIPIIHMNIRYFELSNGTCWFGGGIDLTPHYVVDNQATWFHEQLKNVCSVFNENAYSKFKSWADDYFYIPHRSETRGVGGIFYDYLKPNVPVDGLGTSFTKNQLFEFMKSVGNSFAPIYTHLIKLNENKEASSENKNWQLLRRGRYVEFNLAWDRGTKFGLETNGRTESILMSLPPQANWTYDFKPELGSLEAKTLEKLIKGIDWTNSEV